MEKISRRNFTSQMLHSLFTLWMVEMLSQERLLGKDIDRLAKHWLAEVEEISRAMHMLIGGEMHAWHFDRLEDESGHMIINPTLDRALAQGEASTTLDDKDNVHWFKATSDVAFSFNLAVYDVNPAVKFSGRQFYLDPAGGEKLGAGSLRVRHLTAQEAHKLYGKS